MKHLTIILLFFHLLLYYNNAIGEKIDSLLLIINKNQEDTASINKLIKSVQNLSYINCKLAMQTTIKITEICKKTNYVFGIITSQNVTGNIFVFEGNYKKGINLYFENLKLSKKYDLKLLEAHALNNIGGTNFKLKNDEIAISYIKKALKIYLLLNAISEIAGCYTNLGTINYSNKKYDESINQFKTAISFYEKCKDDGNKAVAYTNLGLVYYDLRNFSEHKFYLFKAIQINKKNNNIRGLIYNYLILGEDLICEKQYIKSKFYLDSAMFFTKKMGYSNIMASILIRYAKLDSAKNDFEKAYCNLSLYARMKDSINKSIKSDKITEMQTKYEEEIRAKENLLQEILIQRKNNQIIVLLVLGFLTSIIILVLFYFNFRLKINSKKISEQQNTINTQINELHTNKVNYYKESIESHQRELTTNALLLVETQEKFKKLIEELRNIIIPSKIEIEKVVSKYQSNSKDKFWQEFELRFEQVHQDFYKTISQSYPDISPSESKLCALLKLNMSTKEIVAITSSTENSVNVARSRIRTKLGLNRDENLVTFLNQL